MQLLGRQKRGDFVELHAEVAELTTKRAPLMAPPVLVTLLPEMVLLATINSEALLPKL